MLTDNISSAVPAAIFDRYAARGLADDAPDRKEDLRLGLQHILWALGHLKDAGVSDTYREDLARLSHDAITKRDDQLNRDLDAAGCWFDPMTRRRRRYLTTEATNHRNHKVLSGGRFIGWITRSDYLMGEPRWGFKDTTGALPETGWNYPTVSECLAAVQAMSPKA